MVVLDESTENFIGPSWMSNSTENLEEERRKTGRYLAAGIVIFLVGLGLYHAVIYGSTKLSTLLGAAFIMFLYLLWLLYASQRKKNLSKSNEIALRQEIEDVITHATKSKEVIQVPEKKIDKPMLSRSYSIA